MRIEHIAIWTNNLEELEEFYVTYFQATPSEKYVNPAKQFDKDPLMPMTLHVVLVQEDKAP